MNTPVDTRKHLYDLLKDFDTAMLVTCGTDEMMHARPMAVAELSEDGTAYFMTGANSPKVAQLKADSAVTLSFQSGTQFASVCGTASIVRDQAVIDRLWKETWKVWFPQGKSDPSITLIRFTAQEGEYWDNAGIQGLKYMFGAVKAYAKGETPHPDEAQHAKVEMKS